MTASQFKVQFDDYHRWKDSLRSVLGRYREWLERHDVGGPDSIRRIAENIEMLSSDRFTIAFVAEFSRGKSELINAIFFAEHGRRLLPSSPGRTTMCPTELFYDGVEESAYVRLLPIETRLEERTIADFKQNVGRWTTIALDPRSPEQMQTALSEVVRVKQVCAEDAQRLGLIAEDGATSADSVEIPCWRHAMISYPHPLLRQGLTILDTPGLNALGSEPELTLNMLPKAQAVVFVLGADTGVTRSDMDMWTHHVKRANRQAMIVVLNKIDTLWDELQNDVEVNAAIARQGVQVARTLGMQSEQIFPVSAQKALLAKVRNDADLLRSSRLVEFESFLSERLMAVRRDIILESLRHDVLSMLRSTRTVLASRIDETDKELNQLAGLSGDRKARLSQLMGEIRAEQSTYLKRAERYQTSRNQLRRQVSHVIHTSSIAKVDLIIGTHRAEMSERWTTHGLRSSMKGLFDRFRETMVEVQTLVGEVRQLVQRVYREFDEQLGLKVPYPRLVRMSIYRKELEDLYQEAEAYRSSPVTTLTEQSFLVQKFFVSIVSRARDIFFRAESDMQDWSKDVLNPLVKEMWRHKRNLQAQMQVLREIGDAGGRLEGRIDELREVRAQHSEQMDSLKQLHSDFDQILFASTPDDQDAPELQRARA